MKAMRKANGNQGLPVRLSIYVVVIMVATLAGCNQKEAEVNEEHETPLAVNENNSAVTDYVRFIQNDENEMSLDHDYTNQALNKLTEAITALANEIDFDIEADLDKVKEYSERITKDPFTTTHADNIRKAADVLTGTLQKIQQQKYPAMENDLNKLKEACGAINPEVLTLEQKSAVKNFFNQAADVLDKMS